MAGGFWTPDNRIVLGIIQGGLEEVSADGGVPWPLTSLGQSQQEQSHLFPWLLPDGHHFIYTRSGGPTGGIYVGALDKKPQEQSLQRLLPDQTNAMYVPTKEAGRDSGKGYLLFTREGILMAQPFDADRLKASGEPISVAEGIRSAGVASASSGLAASANGLLA